MSIILWSIKVIKQIILCQQFNWEKRVRYVNMTILDYMFIAAITTYFLMMKKRARQLFLLEVPGHHFAKNLAGNKKYP